jgi:predicted GTPase
MRRVILVGAGGREFHDFNVAFRHDPDIDVVGFTAPCAGAPERRRYPPALAGPRYPNGIAIRPARELPFLVEGEWADEVVLSWSGLSAGTLLDKASAALATGADFRVLGPETTMLRSTRPVVAVCGARGDVGKTNVTRSVVAALRGMGRTVAVVAHPLTSVDLERTRAQRFETLAQLDAAQPSAEERRACSALLADDVAVHSGIDYEPVLRAAESEADVLVWDGADDDFPFIRPDLLIAVLDPQRAGGELSSHAGRALVERADAVVVAARGRILGDLAELNPSAVVLQAPTPAALAPVVAAVARGQERAVPAAAP